MKENRKMQILKVYRAPYGNKATPKELREYKIRGVQYSPVGTIDELIAWIKSHELPIKAIEFEDNISNDNFIVKLDEGYRRIKE